MHALTRLIKEDMKPALGVTEPAAIAFAVALARNHLPEEVTRFCRGPWFGCGRSAKGTPLS